MTASPTGVHRRKNLLTGDWVLVSPHRNNRPWKGATEPVSEPNLSIYQHDCALCPGNVRANGESNPHYQDTFIFTNDFSALFDPKAAASSGIEDELWVSKPAMGECRVVVFCPDHHRSLPLMSESEIAAVVRSWVSEFNLLKERFEWIQVFENKGETMGCSQPHPHGQIWGHNFVPSLVSRENDAQADYYDRHQVPLLLDYSLRESQSGKRTVAENDDWIVVVPYWAAWPFETLLMVKRPVARMDELTASLQLSLAKILKELTIRYDNVFHCSFPYSMGWHGAPNNLEDVKHWQLHAHFFPPLLRSAEIKKHMVGFEMLAEAQRDLTPESAAAVLRSTDTIHYSNRG